LIVIGDPQATVNVPLTAVQLPAPDTTVIGPVVAPAGTVTVIVLSSTKVNDGAGVPLNNIAEGPVNNSPVNALPVIVITSPLQPVVAESEVMIGVISFATETTFEVVTQPAGDVTLNNNTNGFEMLTKSDEVDVNVIDGVVLKFSSNHWIVDPGSAPVMSAVSVILAGVTPSQHRLYPPEEVMTAVGGNGLETAVKLAV